MRTFLTILILFFTFQTWAKADDIRDFEIENIARLSNRDLLIDKIDSYKEDLSIISEDEEGQSSDFLPI